MRKKEETIDATSRHRYARMSLLQHYGHFTDMIPLVLLGVALARLLDYVERIAP